MLTVFKFNRVSSLTLPNIILQKDLISKSQYKSLSYKNNTFCQNFNENKKDTWYVAHAHSIYYMPGKSMI